MTPCDLRSFGQLELRHSPFFQLAERLFDQRRGCPSAFTSPTIGERGVVRQKVRRGETRRDRRAWMASARSRRAVGAVGMRAVDDLAGELVGELRGLLFFCFERGERLALLPWRTAPPERRDAAPRRRTDRESCRCISSVRPRRRRWNRRRRAASTFTPMKSVSSAKVAASRLVGAAIEQARDEARSAGLRAIEHRARLRMRGAA